MTAALIAVSIVATLAILAAVAGWVVAVLQARRIHALRSRLAFLVLSDAPPPPVMTTDERAKWTALHDYMTSDDGWSNHHDIPNN